MFNNELVKMDTALEILAELIAKTSSAIKNESNKEKKQKLKQRIKKYMQQRNEVYAGNEETIEYVLDVYGSYLKEQR